jgi:hypothetical protein
MSIEQVEDAILAPAPQERRQLLGWFDAHRHELFGEAELSELTEAQKTEVRRRRNEYQEHPERFLQMDEKALDEMFARLRRHVTARVSSAS